MSKKIFTALLVLFISAWLSSPVLAQRQTGSLTGRIVDQSGEPLPGCALTLTSPALMGTKTFVSTEDGNFRFPTLSSGTYTLTTEIPGFKKVNLEGIIVSVGKTTTITVTMEQSTLEEEITVTSEAPVVDIKSTTKSVNYTKALLDNIPLGRSMAAVVESAPGNVGPSSHGGTRASSRYNLDGVDMTKPGSTGGALTELSFDLYEEVELQTGAHPADVGNVPGAYINIVTKSGGNKFHGRLNAYYFTESFVGSNFSDEDLDTLGVSSPSMDKSIKDFSITLGGPIFKDKLWFFLSGRFWDSARLITNFPLDYTVDEKYGFGKLTFQATKNIKFMGYFNYVTKNTPHARASAVRSPEATGIFDDKSTVINAQINWILNQNAFLDIRGIYVNNPLNRLRQPGATHLNYDRGTGMWTGGDRWDDLYEQGRYAVMPSFTVFLDNFLGGNHELKIGGEYELGYTHIDMWSDYPIRTYSWNGSPYYFGGNRGQFVAYGFPEKQGPNEKIANMRKYAMYFQDNWTIQNRLTLNLGLRYWHASGDMPKQVYPEVPYWTWLDPVFFGEMQLPAIDALIAFKGFAPRLGLSFDIFGNGKTVAKASYSRYYDYMLNVFHLAYRVISNAFYSWIDTNMDGDINVGDTFIRRSTFGRDPNPAEAYGSDLKSPYWTEYIVGVDHELVPNFRIGVSFIYKYQNDIYADVEKNNEENWATPYTVTDPGYDGIIGSADDAQLTIFDRTNPFEGWLFTNPADAWRKYRAFEIVFEKRMANRWQFFGSIVYSKNWGTAGGNLTDATEGAFDTPNYYINREGRTTYDRPLVIKIQGTYQLPYGLNLSASFLHSSGSPFTRTVDVYAPNYAGFITVNAEPQGSRRNPSFNRLDLRLEKEFAFGDFGKLGLFLDVFNALNRADISVRSSNHGRIAANGSFTPNALWHTISSVSSPRVIKLGARFSF